MPRKKSNTLSIQVGKRLYYLLKSGMAHEVMFEANEQWMRKLTDIQAPFLLFSYRNGYEEIPFKTFSEVSFYCRAYKDRLKYTIEDLRYGYPNEREFIPDDDNKKYLIIKVGEEC